MVNFGTVHSYGSNRELHGKISCFYLPTSAPQYYYPPQAGKKLKLTTVQWERCVNWTKLESSAKAVLATRKLALIVD